ncbi:MAG: PrsW family intramembrane metalloprotease [Anaerovibrio sp.]|uniref:PrsW family intramembrane metalloprotease n=1 Tax=Anaerovibrio sp. TaxID=1872532 RepID=UPI0025F4618D|nr:PrsW family glutamic-type intramembrane protease [Anaerovibrio sp.]MCR5176048.1 PrsW family intramembrane metalloprotease [Anaerovibrio sp.]
MDDLLIAMTVLPGLAFLYYIYTLDKFEKEPTDLLMKLVGFGALCCIPAVVLELLAGNILDAVLDQGTMEYAFVEAFLGVAIIEEGCKLFALKKTTWTHPAFNYRFDGIVYAVCVSMGFAILENFFYVFEGGLAIAVSRAITSIPGHGVFAIFMGIYYGNAKEYLHRMNRPVKDRSLRMALIIPTLMHGFYDFCILTEDEFMLGVFVIFILVLYYFAYREVKRMSKDDHRIYY